MKLYKIIVQHFSQKDSHTSIEAYLAAKNDEEVYEWMKTSPIDGMYNGWDDMEDEDGPFDIYDDEYNVIGSESFKEKMLRIKGEVNDEDLELEDLYYGKTIYGWEEISQIDDEQLKILKQLQVVVEV